MLDVPYTANDPNGDELTAVAASSDDGIVSASVIAPGTIRLTANGAGTAQITLTVGDGVNDPVSVSFNVTVGAANGQPQLGSADSQTVSAGANIIVSLSASDPDGDPLTFTAVSDNPAVATASAAPSATGVDVTITGVMAGSATIRVDAEDGRGGVATTSFAVSVTSANQPPVIEQVPDQTLMVGEEISLTLTISDGNGDPIVLTAIAQDQAVATAEAVGSDTVVLRGVAEGTTTVDLTADDNQGGVVMSGFQVTVVPGETAFDLMAYPVVPEIPQEMAASLNLVYQGGLSLGNRPNAFSKVGDEAVASQNFLVPFATGLYDLGNYGALQSVLDAYSATTVREGDTPANSLTVESLAAGAQFSIDTLFTAAPGGSACDALGGGTNLACEFQLTRPSIALISFSAPNVVFMPAEQFRSELQTLVREAQSTYGVIPVLATIPAGGGYTTEQLAEYNRAIVEVAQASGVPLWNLWRAMQERGIGDPTGVAPEGPANLTDAALSYGVNVRNLTALQTLQAVRQAVGIQ